MIYTDCGLLIKNYKIYVVGTLFSLLRNQQNLDIEKKIQV
jgi:hypothetical protein